MKSSRLQWFAMAMLLQSGAVFAVHVENRSSSLRISQKLGSWELVSGGKTLEAGGDLEKQIELSIERNETLSIVIEDQNPLLFSYTQETTTTEASDFTAASSFAAILAKLLGNWTPPASGVSPPVGGAVLQTPASEAEEKIEEIKAEIFSLKGYLDSFPTLLVSSTSVDLATVAKAKQDVAAWNLPQRQKNLDAGWSSLGEIMGRLDLKKPGDQAAMLEILRFQNERTKCDDAIKQLTTFASLMAKVGSPLQMASISYDQKKRSLVTVKISVNSSNAKLAPDLPAKAQTITVGLSPYSPVRLGFGGAVVYSFVDDPTFSAEKAEGGFKIVEKSGSDNFVGQKVAAMLTFTPRVWERGSLSGEFHLGVNPEKDQIGLFLGAGIRFLDTFSFGAGFTFQQVKKLATGLSPGGLIESPEKLKLDTEYASGFYLAITATTK